MSKESVKICGRSFELDIIYDCFDNEEVLPEQKESAATFLKNSRIFDGIEKHVEAYIISSTGNNDFVIDNIFKYIMPTSIYIPRTRSMEAALFCDYKFDAENGIAILFENEKFKEIVPQDKIL